jgi:tetratricopeptide (TPR) repeat protein
MVLRAALRRDPQNASLKGDLARVEAEIGGLEAGLAAAHNFAGNDPDNSLYDRVSAELYEKAGRREEAIGLLEKTVAGRPSDTDLTVALSRLYRRMGVPDKAEAVLKTRLEAGPKLCRRLGLSVSPRRAKTVRRRYRRIFAARRRWTDRPIGAEQSRMALSKTRRDSESSRIGSAGVCDLST